MQHEKDDGIVISCDFCGGDWDEERPMIEGHRGSVICLDCLRHALDEATPGEAFTCTMCLRDIDADVKSWRRQPSNTANASHTPPPGLNPTAAICWPDIRLAAKTFHKDKEVDFRWDPAKYPL